MLQKRLEKLGIFKEIFPEYTEKLNSIHSHIDKAFTILPIHYKDLIIQDLGNAKLVFLTYNK